MKSKIKCYRTYLMLYRYSRTLIHTWIRRISIRLSVWDLLSPVKIRSHEDKNKMSNKVKHKIIFITPIKFPTKFIYSVPNLVEHQNWRIEMKWKQNAAEKNIKSKEKSACVCVWFMFHARYGTMVNSFALDRRMYNNT